MVTPRSQLDPYAVVPGKLKQFPLSRHSRNQPSMLWFSWFTDDKVEQASEKSLPRLFTGESLNSPNDDSPLDLFLMVARDKLSPVAQVIDDATDGWALNYANLSPESETTPIGQAFLATNLAYASAGFLLSVQGDATLGLLTEVVSVASFVYHYTQLQASTMAAQDATVRTALMVDYICAFTSIFVGLVYLVIDQQLPPLEGFVSAGAGLACLFACWVWERGMPYIVLHSMWHLFSAYAAYSVGTTHLAALS